MDTSTLRISSSGSGNAFAAAIEKISGQKLLACYQCRRCAAGCPVGEESGVTPDRLIRMLLLGDAASLRGR